MRAFLQAYDKVNLGDDLFIRFLVNRYPKVQFYMWSDKVNKENFKDLQNLHILNREGWFPNLLQKLRPSFRARLDAIIKNNCNCCIYIGGSIFQEYPTWKNIVEAWDYQTKHYKYFVLGANFGPYQTEAYKDGMKQIFHQVEDVCFRDQYSYNLFKESPKVRVAPDILFAQPFPEAVEEKKQIFMSVINCRNRANGFAEKAEQYQSCIREMIKDYVQNGYRVKLVSFCKEEGDEEICDKLYQELSEIKENIGLLYYNGKNHEELLYEMAASEYVVGTRFHATVLGLACGKKVLPVIYSDKTKNMLADIGFSGVCMDLREEIETTILKDLQNRLKTIDNKKIIVEAGLHFEKLNMEFERK